MNGLGYRQRAVLAALDSRTVVPCGYLARTVGCDGKTLHMALLGLARRGLVVRVSHGKWRAA